MKLHATLNADRVALPRGRYVVARLRLFGCGRVDGAFEDGEPCFKREQTGSGGILEKHLEPHSLGVASGGPKPPGVSMCQAYNKGVSACQ